MTYTTLQIWLIILGLGLGTFLLRFSFLGAIGRRPMPEWALRHLRYTAVAIIPGLMAPQVFFPAATGGQTDPARLIAAGITLAVGLWTRSLLWAMLAGAASLTAGLLLLG